MVRATAGGARNRVIGPRGPAYWLSAALAAVRGIAVYIWVTVALNAAVWLARIVPAVTRGGTPGYLRGTGLHLDDRHQVLLPTPLPPPVRLPRG